MTINASVNVTPGSAVGDFHHKFPLNSTMVIKQSKLDTKIKVMSVKPSGKNILHDLQSIASLIIFFTKSTTHSMKVCTPVGFIWSFLVTSIDKTSTITLVTSTIVTFDKSKSSQGTPKAFSTIGAS